MVWRRVGLRLNWQYILRKGGTTAERYSICGKRERTPCSARHIRKLSPIFSTGLSLLKALPNTPERRQQELSLQVSLSVPLILMRGYTAPEVEAASTRARAVPRNRGHRAPVLPCVRPVPLLPRVRETPRRP
jgi:hypothetical protein